MSSVLLCSCQTIRPFQDSEPYFPAVSDSPHSLQSKVQLTSRWIVSVSEAQELIQAGAIILNASSRGQPKVPGAIPVTWQQFSQQKKPHRGKLKSNDVELSEQLQALGISAQTPVLVVGNPRKEWGEEGRLVWMLRTLGHSQSYIVDGGVTALKPIRLPLRKIQPGNFKVQRDARWTITQQDLKDQSLAQTLKVIDSRETREYAGQTPYGETRGGHLPHAKHLYFKALLKPDGTLLPHSELIAKIESLGIQPSDSIVIYCTGGIRSGWLTTVLVSLGYQAKNYPGSMWEWSASPPQSFPLIKSAP